MKKRKSAGLWKMLAVLFICYAYAKFQGGFVSWFVLYTVLPVGIFSILLYFFAFRKVSVERSFVKQKTTAGDELVVTITGSNPWRIPMIFLLVNDTYTAVLTGKKHRVTKLLYPGIKPTFEIQYVIKEIQRGIYRWDEFDLQTGDFFGLMKKRKSVSQKQEVVVYPKFHDIHYWRSFNEKNTGNVYSFQKVDENVSAVVGVRDYAPGDRLAQIHWKASARMNQLKTKEYEHQVTNDFMFFFRSQSLD